MQNLNKKVERELLISVSSCVTEIDFLLMSGCKQSKIKRQNPKISTHGLILLENLCRRMRAMVVRTTIVVHMILFQGSPALGLLVVRAPRLLLPSERLEWKRQSLWCNNLTIPVFPLGSRP